MGVVTERLQKVVVRRNTPQYGWWSRQYHHTGITPQHRFMVRHPLLRELEQHTFDGFKVSCRFNDLLRCGDTKHFISCFAPKGEWSGEPFARLYDPRWAVAFLTDRSGAIQARSLLRLNDSRGVLYVYKTFGNGLEQLQILMGVDKLNLMINGQRLGIRRALEDVYLTR